MSAIIDIYLDLRNRKLVSSSQASGINGAGDWQFPRVWNNESLNMRWHFLELDQSSNPRTPNAIVAVSGLALTVSIFDITGATTLATTAPGGWTADVSANTLSGQLNLNTGPMATAFSGVTSINALLEVQIVSATGINAFRTQIAIDKSFIASAVPGSITSASYMTREEILAICVKYVGNPDGAGIELISEDGTKTGLLYIDNDGVFHGDAS